MQKLHEVVLNKEDKHKLESVGFDVEGARSASFLMNDDKVVLSDVEDMEKGLVLIPLKKGLEKYSWLEERLWRLVPLDKDEFTRRAKDAEGYLIYVPPGLKIKRPLQACFFIKSHALEQKVHNVIVMGKGSSLDIINGCATANYDTQGMHIGITEIYIEENAYLTYTMIHEWAPGVEVRARTAVHVKREGQFVSNYISLQMTSLTQSAPQIYLEGEGAKARLTSLVFAPDNAVYDLGGSIYLKEQNTAGEIISRVVSNGGRITSRGDIIARAEGVRGHMECNGIILKEHGEITAVPVLSSSTLNADLTHEAAVGKISRVEVNYLKSRGLTEEEAVQFIIEGFLDTKLLKLPQSLEENVEKTMELLKHSAL